MIYIIRHGKTELNIKNVLQGRSDYPLNDEGILQAKAAAERLKGIHFDHVFSSPLIRALQTAEIVAPYAQPVTDDRLIEMDYGPYEGTNLNDLPPELIVFFSDAIITSLKRDKENYCFLTNAQYYFKIIVRLSFR